MLLKGGIAMIGAIGSMADPTGTIRSVASAMSAAKTSTIATQARHPLARPWLPDPAGNTTVPHVPWGTFRKQTTRQGLTHTLQAASTWISGAMPLFGLPLPHTALHTEVMLSFMGWAVPPASFSRTMITTNGISGTQFAV